MSVADSGATMAGPTMAGATMATVPNRGVVCAAVAAVRSGNQPRPGLSTQLPCSEHPGRIKAGELLRWNSQGCRCDRLAGHTERITCAG